MMKRIDSKDSNQQARRITPSGQYQSIDVCYRVTSRAKNALTDTTGFRRNRGSISLFGLSEVLLIGVALGIVLMVITMVRSSSSTYTPGGVPATSQPIMRLAFNGEGDQLILQRGISEIDLYDVKTRKLKLFYRADGHTISDVVVNREANTMLLTLDGNELRGIRDREIVASEQFLDRQKMTSALSSNGKTAVCITDGTNVRSWDFGVTEPTPVLFTIPVEAQRICLDPLGSKLFVSTVNGRLDIFDAVNGRPISTLSEHGITSRSLSISEDGRWMVSIQADSGTLFDLEACIPVWSDHAARGDEFLHGRISPDGNWVAICGSASGLRVLERSTALVHHQFPEGSSAYRFAFTPTSQQVYTGDSKGSICAWSLTTTETTIQPDCTDIVGNTPPINTWMSP
jgi:WD40 repeat protein